MRFFLFIIIFLLSVISSQAVNLPPELKVVKENQMVKLSWQVNPELDVTHFILERSNDAIAFKTLVILTRPDTDDSSNQFVHMDALPLGEEHFYRLKMIGKDGVSTYSKVVRVN